MDDFIHNVSDEDGQPVNREVESEAYTDPNGNIVVMPKAWETVSVGPDGALTRHKIGARRFLDCNCTADKPIGGRCGEEGCGHVSCVDCFSRCQQCSVGLCVRHRREMKLEDGTVLTLCSECLGRLKRQRLMRRLLGFFVGFEPREER